MRLKKTESCSLISDTDLGHRLVLQRRLGWGLHASLHLVLVREEGEHGLLEREAGVADTRRHEWLRRHQRWLGREHGRQHLDTVNGHGNLSCRLSWSLTPNIGRNLSEICRSAPTSGWTLHTSVNCRSASNNAGCLQRDFNIWVSDIIFACKVPELENRNNQIFSKNLVQVKFFDRSSCQPGPSVPVPRMTQTCCYGWHHTLIWKVK